MAKRRRTVTRSHTGSSTTYRAGFSRGSAPPAGRRDMRPPSERGNNRIWWIVGGVAVAITLLGLVDIYGFSGNNSPGASTLPSNAVGAPHPTGPVPTVGPTVNTAAVHAPSATPLASPMAQPAGDGTTATVTTDLGPITFALYNQSAPVA